MEGVTRSWWNCPFSITTCSSFNLLKALFNIRPCKKDEYHGHINITRHQSHAIHIILGIQYCIPLLIVQLRACKHEQALFDRFYDIYPWPVNPFEDSGVQQRHKQIVSQIL
jgi:hypothetical protein